MTSHTISTISNIIDSLESKAGWRSDVAERFPNDERNGDVAETLQELADEIRELAASGAEICQQVEDLENSATENDQINLWQWHNEVLSSIWFCCSSGTKLLEQYREKLEELMQKRVEDENATEDDDTPHLHALVKSAAAGMRRSNNGNAQSFLDRGLSNRTIKTLLKAGIDAPERLLFLKQADLKAIAGIGKVSGAEIAAYRQRFVVDASSSSH